MCGRYYYSDKGADSKNAAIAAMMEKYYKGRCVWLSRLFRR